MDPDGRITTDDVRAVGEATREAVRNITPDDIVALARVIDEMGPPSLRAIRKAARAMVLSRDQILKHSEVVTERVEIPEWPGDDGQPGVVIVRGMTGRERDAWEASMFEQRGKKMIARPDNVRAKLVVRCCVNEEGARLFFDSDVEQLGGLAAAPISRLYDVAARLSGVSEEDVEELARDFGTTPGGSSSTDSPTTSTPPSENSSGEPTASS